MSREGQAKKAAVVQLLMSFPSSQGLGESATLAYVMALAKYSVEAVVRACARFTDPEFKRKDPHWHPSAVEIAEQAALFDRILGMEPAKKIDPARIPAGYETTKDGRMLIVPIGKPIPPGFKTHGGTVDYGHGLIDLFPLDPEEREIVEAQKGWTTDGRNMARMPLIELRKAIGDDRLRLEGKQVDLLDAPRERVVMPKLQRM
jgi:hypothetical protein